MFTDQAPWREYKKTSSLRAWNYSIEADLIEADTTRDTRSGAKIRVMGREWERCVGKGIIGMINRPRGLLPGRRQAASVNSG